MKINKLTAGLLLGVSSVTFAATEATVEQECSVSIAKTAPNSRYEMNANGTVKDRNTGLTWMRCQLGKTWNSETSACEGEPNAMYWQAALNEVQSIKNSESHALYQFAGKSNWRLPNIKELVSLSEHGCRTPALNNKAFNQAFPWGTPDPAAAGLRAYVWSNTHMQEGNEILTLDVRNAEVIGYGPTVIQGAVLLVTQD